MFSSKVLFYELIKIVLIRKKYKRKSRFPLIYSENLLLFGKNINADVYAKEKMLIFIF